MEEEEDEEEEEPRLPPSDLGGVPWKEAVRIHALLKGKSEEELEASKSFEPGNEEEEEEEEYEEEEEEDYDEEEEESSEGQNKICAPNPALSPKVICFMRECKRFLGLTSHGRASCTAQGPPLPTLIMGGRGKGTVVLSRRLAVEITSLVHVGLEIGSRRQRASPRTHPS